MKELTFRKQIEDEIYFATLPSCENCCNKGCSSCDYCVIGKNQDKVDWGLSDEKLKELSASIIQSIDDFLWSVKQ